jgi:hypothetical protein
MEKAGAFIGWGGRNYISLMLVGQEKSSFVPFCIPIVFCPCEKPGMSKKVRGSCLCGGVRFEVEPPFIRANHCHCDRCRKHSGSAVCTQVRVLKEQFRLLAGEELIRVYGKGEGAVKAFCITCGSSLFGGDWPEGPQVSIRMGAFDDDPGIRPQFHTYVDSRAPWDAIADNLPQHAEAWNP